MRILVVDDDQAMCLLLVSRLHALGHYVEAASNGEEAWATLESRQFDLLVCDWNMPVMNGIELCRKIRSSEWPSYVYVILCTAMNQKADFLAGMEAGADDFIVKPVEFADLDVRVRAAQRLLDLQSELAAQNRNLRELYGKLRAAYDTIESNLQAAAAAQLQLLPKKHALHRSVNLEWLLIPSLFLAGDMLNYFLFGDDKLVFYHLDVAGHGIPAALLSVMLNRILMPIEGSPISRTGQSSKPTVLVPPAEVVSELNRRFQAADDSYFTMLYGVFDLASRELSFCQAGHPGPLVLSPSGSLTRLGKGGFPVGLMPDMEYEEENITLQPGDRLISYSDGITECLNRDGERFSEDNLLTTLRQCAGGTVEHLVTAIRDDIGRWRDDAPLSDDLSLLALESC